MMTGGRASLSRERLEEIQEVLREAHLDGWLLYDFHGNNTVAGKLLGLGPLSRRYFVLIPAAGRPAALVHRIEEAPWAEWEGERHSYLRWQELEEHLGGMLEGAARVAMEYSPFDAVPYLDRIPAGVVELVRRAGPEIVSSAELVTRFHARWSAEERASHERASAVVADAVRWLFDWIGGEVRSGGPVDEWRALETLRSRLRENGLTHEPDGIVAAGPSGGDAHYGPAPGRARAITTGQPLLVDCWGAEPGGIFADQTWMAYLGEPPADFLKVWRVVRDARDRAIDEARSLWKNREPVRGAALDQAARRVVEQAGYGESFVHRTGHSIDRELHGAGPHLDGMETSDDRVLVEGVGFSVEPGIYLPERFGVRSEVNVYLAPEGPVVTTPSPQVEPYRIDI